MTHSRVKTIITGVLISIYVYSREKINNNMNHVPFFVVRKLDQ